MSQEDSETRTKCSITLAEATDRGMIFPQYSTPPEESTCEFCQKPRPAHGLMHPLFDDRMLMWFENPRPCDCAEAVYQRERDGAAREMEEMRRVEADDARIKAERIAFLVSTSRIKPRFADKTFTTFEETPDNVRALTVSRKYTETFDKREKDGKGLYFVGEVGTGKTHLVHAVALALMDILVSVIVTNTIAMLSDLKGTFGDSSREEQSVFREYQKVGVLVLDDFGKEPPTDWALSILFSLINLRYEEMKPVIITTQYSDDELVNRLARKGDMHTAKAIVSRLHSMCYLLECKGEDWRGKDGS